MNGKVCLITGGNAGIGFATAKALAQDGAEVWIMSRSLEKGEAARDQIKEATRNENIFVVQADLGSQRQIREAAAQLRQSLDKLDVLVNNAGTWISKLQYTEEGIEKVFAVNHLGPFLLTRELYPLLKKSPEARVINLSSDNHYQASIQFDDLYLEKSYHGLKSYAQSKLGNVLFTIEFNRRKPDAQVSIFAVQPGLVYTDIGLKHTTPLHAFAWKVRRTLWRGKTPAEGAATSIHLAREDNLAEQSGTYWDNCKSKPSSTEANDPEVGSRLWEKSLELCGLSTFFPE